MIGKITQIQNMRHTDCLAARFLFNALFVFTDNLIHAGADNAVPQYRYIYHSVPPSPSG